MYKDAIQFTSDNECYTPKSVVRFFGAFDYDPATTTEKAKEFKIPNYDTIETDGLSKDWSYRRIWINPPFTLKYDFLKKAVEANKKYDNDIYILLPIGFMTTKKFHDAMSGWGGAVYLPNGRIKFESGIGRKFTSPAFGSVIIKLQKEWSIIPVDVEKLLS